MSMQPNRARNSLHSSAPVGRGARALLECASDGVRARERDNLSVVEAHAKKHGAQVPCRVRRRHRRGAAEGRRRVGQAARFGALRLGRGIHPAVAHGNHRPARVCDGSRARKLQQVGVAERRVALGDGRQVDCDALDEAGVCAVGELGGEADAAVGAAAGRPGRDAGVVGAAVVPCQAHLGGKGMG